MKRITDKHTGKEIKVVKAVIRVSSHPTLERNVFVQLQMTAVFPGCRKNAVVSETPMAGCVWAKSLYDYHGEACVDPEVWRAFLRSLPVVSDDLFPVEITPDLAAYALAHEERTCDACYEAKKHDLDRQAQLWGDGPTPAMRDRLVKEGSLSA